MSNNVLVIQDSEFDSEVLKAEQPVLVYFWAGWCGPCRLVSPSIDAIATTYHERVKVVKMDIDQNPDTVKLCKVEGVPALRLFKSQEIVQSHEGAITKPKLIEWLDTGLS
ncbi:Thioredoxin-2 [Planktothrix serta PCC 8927]|uniref:Thioredoxin n=1 Tax=Planktothrix serta PCC 8927 TaxID=671068 RepID=A0A7Z9BJF1_9CYAN|nr:thioredoxin family protein [Planktothrix serta]VXD11589.1 Thioredoxin-2 [Planktothrix serta PCC 8927]